MERRRASCCGVHRVGEQEEESLGRGAADSSPLCHTLLALQRASEVEGERERERQTGVLSCLLLPLTRPLLLSEGGGACFTRGSSLLPVTSFALREELKPAGCSPPSPPTPSPPLALCSAPPRRLVSCRSLLAGPRR